MSDNESQVNGPVAVHAFTYNKPDDVPEDVFTASAPGLLEVLESIGGDKYIYQLERGGTTGRLHLQGYIHLTTKARPSTLHGRLPDEYRGLVFRRASTAGCGALRSYCLKSATRVAGPWTDPTHVAVLAAERDADELKYRPEVEDPELVANPYPWQQTVLSYLDGPVHPRSLLWICDEEGNGGKSSFVKWQCSVRKMCSFLSYTKTSDMLSLVLKWGPKKTYLIDLTRAKPLEQGIQDLYAGLEMIKNGFIVSGKYEGGFMSFAKPHVVVFANHLPCQEYMSQDRWDIRRIRHSDKALCMV